MFLLIDARHGIKPNDQETMKLLDEAAVSYQVVLTKADKPKASELEAVQAKVAELLAKHPAAYPQILTTSARFGTGIPGAARRRRHRRARALTASGHKARPQRREPDQRGQQQGRRTRRPRRGPW